MSYNKAEQNCEAKAYLAYVEQAIEVPTQEDGIYDAVQKKMALCLAGTALLKGEVYDEKMLFYLESSKLFSRFSSSLVIW